MITTLENLDAAVKENRLRNLATNIVKYQNFNTNTIISKIDNAGYKERTLRFYIDKSIGYVKHGTMTRQLGNFTKYLDECIKDHIQPLTPKNSEKRRAYPMRSKKIKVLPQATEIPVQRVLNKIVKQAKPYNFAVKMSSNLRICDTQEEAQTLKEGLSFFMGASDAKIVKLIIEEIN